MLGGVLSILFAVAMTGEPTLLNLATAASGILLAAGLILLSRGGAGARASAGFVGIAVGVLVLEAAYTAVDPLTTPGSGLVPLDVTLVLVGDVAALIGGLLLGTSLGSLAGGSGLAKAAAYVFLLGGVLQMVAGVPDSGGIIMNSADLGNVGHVLDAVAGIFYVVLGPVLLFVAIRRLRQNSSAQSV